MGFKHQALLFRRFTAFMAKRMYMKIPANASLKKGKTFALLFMGLMGVQTHIVAKSHNSQSL
jgi:hypothetical protein